MSASGHHFRRWPSGAHSPCGAVLQRVHPLILGHRGAGFDPTRALRPKYMAPEPSSSSMRRSRLYLATRSEREGAPVLIWPIPMATTKSAIVVSSVSPDRWLTKADQP